MESAPPRLRRPTLPHCYLRSIVALLDEVREVALPAVVPVEVHRHEDARPAHLVGALPPQSRDFIVRVHLVELEHCELHLLALVLQLLGLRVGLLLALLAAAEELEREEKRGLVLEPTRRELFRTLKGASAEDQSLLTRGDALNCGNALLQARDLIIRIGGDYVRLPSEVADEELHRRAKLKDRARGRDLLFRTGTADVRPGAKSA